MPSGPVFLNNPTSVQRRGLLPHHGRTSSVDSCAAPGRRGSDEKFGEVCGGTMADVAAVCCCCPCTLANIVVLAVYKVPAGLCRRAIRNKRLRKLQKRGMLQQKSRSADFSSDLFDDYVKLRNVENSQQEQKAVEMENEMWQRFYGTGFWRSPSQHEGSSRFQVEPL